MGEPSTVPGRVERGPWSADADLRAILYFLSSFPFLFAFGVGEFFLFAAGWRL